MTKLFVLPYKTGSKSARDLARALGAKRIKREGGSFRPRHDRVVLNWGCGTDSVPPNVLGAIFLNTPEAVSIAANKRSFFRAVAESDIDVTLPEWTTERADALEWVEEGCTVVCRNKLTGHSGEGIVIVGPEDEGDVPNSPLFVKYIKKQDEYRIHIFQGTIITRQRKARKMDVPKEDVNWKVRNLAGGFIFARNEDKAIPACVLDEALKTIEALALDFGAVDIIYNAKQEKAYVLEVNTACGLEGTTLDEYVAAISERV